MTAQRYTFIYEAEGRRVEMSITPDGNQHHFVTAFYMDFLRANAFTIPYVESPDICDLAIDW